LSKKRSDRGAFFATIIYAAVLLSQDCYEKRHKKWPIIIKNRGWHLRHPLFFVIFGYILTMLLKILIPAAAFTGSKIDCQDRLPG
jgi:hypothetical protein